MLVVYDDVNYIKGGFINRNYILYEGKKKWLTINTKGASQNKIINQVLLDFDRRKIENIVFHAYGKSPYYDKIYPIFMDLINYDECNLSCFVSNSIYQLCKLFKIDTSIVYSSNLDISQHLKGQNRIIEICRHMRADTYINPIGGLNLYSRSDFSYHGITLQFMNKLPFKYTQYTDNFISDLSILDVLMFNDIETVVSSIKTHKLV